jgi:hypothetical protein
MLPAWRERARRVASAQSRLSGPAPLARLAITILGVGETFGLSFSVNPTLNTVWFGGSIEAIEASNPAPQIWLLGILWLSFGCHFRLPDGCHFRVLSGSVPSSVGTRSRGNHETPSGVDFGGGP